MAQSGYTPISLYYSTTAATTPVAGNLVNGELAINITDGKLYYKDNTGTVQLLANKNTAGGGVTSISFGSTGLTPSTTTTGAVTVSGTLAVANGGTGVTTSTGTTSVVLSSNPTITGLKETKTAISASDIDLSVGNYFSKTISTTTTFTVSNVPTTGTAVSFILDLTNGGSSTVTWWTGVKWASGTAPTLTTSGRDSLGFYTYDGGTTWTGLVLGLNLS